MTETCVDTSTSMDAAPRPGRGRRVLVCTPFPPRLDARHGGKATAQLLAQLAERNDVALLCLRSAHQPAVDPAIAHRCATVVEVLAHERGPLARRLAWALGMLRSLPPWAVECRSPAFASALVRLVDEWRPEIVEIHLQAMAQYVVRIARVPSVLVDYDPGSAWAEEVLGMTSGARRLARRLELAAWRRYEQATRPRFAEIVVFAERDIAAVAPTAGTTRVTRVPLAVDIPTRPLDPEGSGPPTVVFVGSFGHPPNVDAAAWLAKEIFPQVSRRMPTARLELVGHEPGADVLSLASEAISVHGSVPDVSPFLEHAAVVVAPIRTGGSMRMKVLEALAAGKALVATPRAAEGVTARPGEHLVVAADEHELVDALVELLGDRDRRRRLGENARHWAESNLGWDAGAAAFEQLYERVIGAWEQCE